MKEYRVSLFLIDVIRKEPNPPIDLQADSEMRAIALALPHFRARGEDLTRNFQVDVQELPNRARNIHLKGEVEAWFAMPQNAQFIAQNNLGGILK